jgi:hypothetical protein
MKRTRSPFSPICINDTNQQYMNAALRFLKKYPASIVCYMLYTLLCYRTLEIGLEFHERMRKNPDRSGISLGGEAVAYLDIFLVLVTGIFLLVILINAIVRKEKAFYLWMSLVIVVQTVITLNIR